MYGLPHAGRMADDILRPRLAEADYKPTGITPGLFKHSHNSVTFGLIVDGFGITGKIDQVTAHGAADLVWVSLLVPVASNDSHVRGLYACWNLVLGDECTGVGALNGMLWVLCACVASGEAT